MNSIAFKQTSRLVVMAIASMAPLCLTPIPATAADVLYGGLGGHNNGDSTNDGALVTVNQTNGAVTIVGHPVGVVRISGLAFDSAGDLYATTLIPPGGFPPPTGRRPRCVTRE